MKYNTKMTWTSRIVILFAITLTGALPGTAVAQAPDGYAPPGREMIRDTSPGPIAAPSQGTAPAPAQQAGALPFTGSDLGLVALAGFAVLALGLGLHRLSPRPSARR